MERKYESVTMQIAAMDIKTGDTLGTVHGHLVETVKNGRTRTHVTLESHGTKSYAMDDIVTVTRQVETEASKSDQMAFFFGQTAYRSFERAITNPNAAAEAFAAEVLKNGVAEAIRWQAANAIAQEVELRFWQVVLAIFKHQSVSFFEAIDLAGKELDRNVARGPDDNSTSRGSNFASRCRWDAENKLADTSYYSSSDINNVRQIVRGEA